MRKLLTVLCLALIANFAMAQEETKKGDEFIGHWFIQAQGGAGYTSGETDFGKLISPAASISVGYHFNPVWKLRLNFTGWQAKGAIVYPQYVYKYNYVQGSFDVMVDFCNMAYYKVKRAVNPYFFVGVGAAYAFNNDQANEAMKNMKSKENLWQNDMVTPVGRFGLGMDVRIVDAVAFNIEVNGNMYNDKFNSKVGTKLDWQVNALAGFTFKIGVNKGRKAQEEPVAEAPVAPQQKEAPVQEPAPVQEDPVAKFITDVPNQLSAENSIKKIYFELGKHEIKGEENINNLKELAKLLNEFLDKDIVITGHADKDTGNARINQIISEKRANSVKEALIELGIKADRIQTEWKGDTANDTSVSAEKNRVVICVIDHE